MDLEGFIEFILQMAFIMHQELTDVPSKFLPMLFDKMKQTSLNSKTPLFQRHFQDPEEAQNDQNVNHLTEMVNANPSFQLPAGYVKVKVDKIEEVYMPNPKQYPKESQ